MDRRHILVKAALLVAGIAVLPLQSAQACSTGSYYYQGYGCRSYDYGFPVGAIGGLLFGLLDHHHHGGYAYGGGDHGGSFAGAIARRGGAEQFRGAIAHAGHPGGHAVAGFGSSTPPAHAAHAAAAPHPAAASHPAAHADDHKR